MKSLITVRKIETIKYFTNEFVILNIYIFKLINNEIEMIEIIVKVYLICNLKAKFLVDVDIVTNSNKKSLSRSFNTII